MRGRGEVVRGCNGVRFRRGLFVLALLAGWSCAPLAARPSVHRHTRFHVEATAFCLHGITAAGTRSRTGTVAADPAFLPIGSRIRVRDAGPYSGVYEVTDTGAKVNGRHIDIRLATTAAARRFGRKTVWIQVLKWGNGEVRATS